MGVIGKPRFNNEEVGKDVALMITVVERKVPFWNVVELDSVVGNGVVGDGVVGNSVGPCSGGSPGNPSGIHGAGKGHGTENGVGHGTRHGQKRPLAVTDLHIRAQIKITIVQFYR
jgi:hypothetical protein